MRQRAVRCALVNVGRSRAKPSPQSPPTASPFHLCVYALFFRPKNRSEWISARAPWKFSEAIFKENIRRAPTIIMVYTLAIIRFTSFIGQLENGMSFWSAENLMICTRVRWPALSFERMPGKAVKLFFIFFEGNRKSIAEWENLMISIFENFQDFINQWIPIRIVK